MQPRSIIKFTLPIVIIAIAAGVFQHLKASKPERKKPVLREKVWEVEVVSASRQNLSPTLELYGRVESPELLQAAAPGAGIISEVQVQSGDKVKPGQLLIKIDSRDFGASLAQAESDLLDIKNQISEIKIRHQSNLKALETEYQLLRLAEEEVERMLKLKQQKLGADTILNTARNALGQRQLSLYSRELSVESYPVQLRKLRSRQNQYQAQLDEAQLMIERSTVYSPFDAIISAAPTSVGDRVATGQILVSLYPTNSLEIRAHIPARYISRIQQAMSQNYRQKAIISLANQSLSLELIRLAGEAEPSGIDAYFHSNSQGENLRLGALLPLSFSLPTVDDVIAVPYQAIYGNSRLYLLEENRLKGVNVESVGQYKDTNDITLLLIKSNQINSGDKIVVTHLPNAVSGLKVRSPDNESSQ